LKVFLLTLKLVEVAFIIEPLEIDIWVLVIELFTNKKLFEVIETATLEASKILLETIRALFVVRVISVLFVIELILKIELLLENFMKFPLASSEENRVPTPVT